MEPFPFVPVMCMTLRSFSRSGCEYIQDGGYNRVRLFIPCTLFSPSILASPGWRTDSDVPQKRELLPMLRHWTAMSSAFPLPPSRRAQTWIDGDSSDEEDGEAIDMERRDKLASLLDHCRSSAGPPSSSPLRQITLVTLHVNSPSVTSCEGHA